jgi:hypothetical protein
MSERCYKHTRQRAFVSADDCPYCRIVELEKEVRIEIKNRDDYHEELVRESRSTKEGWSEVKRLKKSISAFYSSAQEAEE